MAVPYIAISIVVFAAIMLLLVFVWHRRQRRSMSPLASIAFALVIAGIVFGTTRWVGYALMGTGVLLAVIDAALKSRRPRT